MTFRILNSLNKRNLIVIKLTLFVLVGKVYAQDENDLEKDIYFKTSLGHLSDAKKLNEARFEKAKKSKNESLLNNYYIQKINIDASNKNLDNLVENISEINECTLSPSERMYFYLALANHFNMANQSQEFKKDIEKAILFKPENGNADDLSTWYSTKLFSLYYFDTNKKDSVVLLLNNWLLIVSQSSDLNKYKYLSKRISNPYADVKERRAYLNEMKDFVNAKNEPFYAYYYDMLRYLFYPENDKEKYSQENFAYLQNAQKFLKETELQNQYEFVYQSLIDYYVKTGNDAEIISLEPFIRDNKIDEGNNDILISMVNAHLNMGEQKEALQLLENSYKDLKYNGSLANTKYQHKLLTAMYSQKQLNQEKNEIANERIKLILLGIGIILFGVIAFTLNKISSNRKLKNLNQELENSYENLQDYISITSHDLRSPIATINNLSEPGVVNNSFERMESNLSSINSISFMSLGVISSLQMHHNLKKNIPFEMKKINLLSLINELLANMDNIIKAKHFQVELDVPKRISIYGNEGLILRLFQNFIENSLKFSSEVNPSVIRINAYQDQNKKVFLEFWDNGKGIDSSRLNKVFDKPEKIDFKFSGSGLGLPFCKEIMDYHKGEISIDSEVGEFTRISLRFPKIKGKSDDNSVRLSLEEDRIF